jgi:hypothetical protein
MTGDVPTMTADRCDITLIYRQPTASDDRLHPSSAVADVTRVEEGGEEKVYDEARRGGEKRG